MRYPIKLKFKTELIPWLVLAAAFAFGVYFYNNFGQEVATHWNFQGEPDGFSGKFAGAWGMPLMLLGLYLLLLVTPILDPRKQRYAEFAGVYHLFKAVILVALFVVYLASGFYNLGYDVNIGKVVPVIVGLLLMLLGNYMAKIKSNWFIGIRTPWTLSSENVWNKSHRFGGKAFMLAGLLVILTPFLGKNLGMAAFIVAMIIAIVGTIAYSYWVYRQEQR